MPRFYKFFFKMDDEEQLQESLIPTDDNDQHDTTQLLADIAKKQLLNITEYLDKSGQEINRRKKLKNAFIIAISSLCIIAIIAFIWAFTERGEALKNKRLIEITSKSNQIATKAYMSLDKDPTLAFRLAEQAYKIHPTPLAKQVIMAAYGEMPFYRKLVGHTEDVSVVKYSPNGKYIVTGSIDNTVKIWNQKGKESIILKGHKAGFWASDQEAINFSPDSKYIITATNDSTARLWDITGKCLAVMKHDGPVNSACFSPLSSNNQLKILTASSDKTVRLWNFNPTINETRKEQPDTLQPNNTLKGHTKGVRLAKFSSDGKYILTLSGDSTVRVWNLKGKIKFILRHSDNIRDANFSYNGNYIITASVDNNARLWNINGKLLHILKGHTAYVRWSLFSPDDKYILTASKDNSVRLWNLKGDELAILRGHTAFIWSIQFSPQSLISNHLSRQSRGQLLIVTASDDGTARLWDLNGTELMVLKGHTSQVMSANFSPDGKYVVTGSGDQTARIWNIQPKENPVLKGHTAYVTDANFSPDGEYIVTAGWDYTARLWGYDGNVLKIFKGHTHYGVSTALFLNNSDKIITGALDATARIWDYSGKMIEKLNTHGFYFNLDISKDDMLLWKSSINKATLWNNKLDSIQSFEDVTTAIFSNTSRYITTITTDSSLYFWQYKLKDSIHYKKFYQIKLPATAFTSVDFSKDSYWFLTTSEDSIARLWKFEDVKNLPEDSIKPSYEYKHPAIVGQPLFSPNSKLFLTVGNDNIVRLFDLNCNIIAVMKGHSDAINDINFSPDGKYIVTCSNDNTVRIWDLQGNELQLFPGHKAAVTKVQFSPDGSYILSASNDHTARLMPVSVENVLHKINIEKVRGTVFQLTEDDKQVYGIID